MACQHRKGELYGGKLAYAIGRQITSVDHIAMTAIPKDKRCTIVFEDTEKVFSNLLYLSNYIINPKLPVFDFSHLEITKKKVVNEKYKRVGRNSPCFCGSGKKFRKCCKTKYQTEEEHCHIVFENFSVEKLFI